MNDDNRMWSKPYPDKEEPLTVRDIISIVIGVLIFTPLFFAFWSFVP